MPDQAGNGGVNADPVSEQVAAFSRQIQESEDDLILRQICIAALAVMVDDGSSYVVLAVRDGEEPSYVAELVRGSVVQVGDPESLREEAGRLQSLREIMES